MCTLVSKQDRQRERKRVKRMSEVMLCSPFPHFPPSQGALPGRAKDIAERRDCLFMDLGRKHGMHVSQREPRGWVHTQILILQKDQNGDVSLMCPSLLQQHAPMPFSVLSIQNPPSCHGQLTNRHNCCMTKGKRKGRANGRREGREGSRDWEENDENDAAERPAACLASPREPP